MFVALRRGRDLWPKSPRALVRNAALLALLLAAVAPGTASSSDLSAADAAYAQGNLAQALSGYQAVLAANPHHFGALWRASRAESELGEDAKGEDRKQLIAKAVEHARAAVRVAPDSARGHLSLAIALGRQARKEGPKTKLALAREIKSEVDHALQLDASLGRAYHVRALWNREISDLNALERMAANAVLGGVPKGASMDNAVNDLTRAVELEPQYVNHRLELGRTYFMLKRWGEARRELEKASSLAPTSNPRDPRYQAEARELLKKVRR
jgi:tetratricopeptide (TPR) repeat protein